MGNRFYFRMATTNMLLNRKFYAPYLLTCGMSVAMLFIIYSMAITDLPGGSTMKMLMMLGTIVIILFSAIFLFYTNSFLIKRRKRELALYNILGMEKRHIAVVMFYETLLTALVSIAGGLLFGVVLDKLMYLVLLNLMHFEVSQAFHLYPEALILTLVVFGVIFLLILAANLRQIVLSNPIELLRGQNAGEREPKVKWPLVVIGALSLAGGYYIAVTTKDVMAAILLFFVAVILVIVGTYCLFTAGSIAVLKTMKRSKGYYYKPSHFVSVSGMLYRMKQNAVGLGNICILSTMVLVTVSTTVSLYCGIESILGSRYPTDIEVTVYDTTKEEQKAMLELVETRTRAAGMNIKQLNAYEALQFSVDKQGDTFVADTGRAGDAEVTYLLFLSPENYENATGHAIQVSPGAVAIYEQSGHLPDTFKLFGETYIVGERLKEVPVKGDLTTFVAVNVFYLVVDSQETLNSILVDQMAAYGEHASEMEYIIQFDVDGDEEAQLILKEDIRDDLKALMAQLRDDGGFSCGVYARAGSTEDFYAMYGSFLFLGLFLGILFLMATVLIIYYKQLIEGYEDRSRFEIMQNVGMDTKLVKSSIHSQILTMFFLPLFTAAVHLFFAFPLLTRCLKLLYLEDVKLFTICTVCTLLVFSLIYGLVYSLTARTYYGIVSSSDERR